MIANKFISIGIKVIAPMVLIAGLNSSSEQLSQISQESINNVKLSYVANNFDDKTRFGDYLNTDNFDTVRNLKIKMREVLNNKVKDYQKIGFFPSADITSKMFEVSFNEGRNQTDYTSLKVRLNFHIDASFNNISLTDRDHFSKTQTKDDYRKDFEKIFSHEMGHIEFSSHPELSNNKKLNDLAYSEIKFNLNDGSINSSNQFVQENFADTYGSLAYLKMHNFDKESIDDVKHDMKIRSIDSLKITKTYGENWDSHDTTASLNKLIKLIDNPVSLEKIKHLNSSQYVELSKQIVTDTYLSYIQNPAIKNAMNNSKNSDYHNLYNEFLNNNDKIDLYLYKSLSVPINSKETVVSNLISLRNNFTKINNLETKKSYTMV